MIYRDITCPRCGGQGAFIVRGPEQMPWGGTSEYRKACSNCHAGKIPVPVFTDGVEAPEVVVLIGSTRFPEAWESEYARLTDEFKIVLILGRMRPDVQLQYDQPELKARLDLLHLRRIDLADRVHVLNVDRYIGESTANELAYAIKLGKIITSMEPLE